MKPLLLLTILFLLSACAAPAPQVTARLSAVEAVNADDNAGYARVLSPRPFVFPRDHGPHPEYQIEWWYYTGNLSGPDGRHFGFQLTFFRRGLTPQPAERESAWASSSIYMAHLALSDVAGGTFHAYERFSRDGAGLAGASGEPFRVFLEDWSVEGSGPEGMTQRLRAAEGAIGLDLTLESSKPPVLQGDQGLSQKGPTAGNASYYYTLSRMVTSGTVTVNGETYAVQGLSWKDHEWGTSALEAGAVGWDWFSIQLEDDRDLMYAQIRTATGLGYVFGSLSEADGSTRILKPADVQLETLATWRSPRTGAEYPSRWRLTLPGEGVSLELTPFLADQELPVTVVYWEGAVQVSGTQNGQPLRGHGYVELTGYAER
ncbi:MAG: carotenoid 1,2-hydratase [Chloroflexaceae bacterium]|nr:carotenoid 1,2-hydratase [Chloroflexaceae bacterium]